MALGSMIRRSAAYVAPLATRFVGSSRCHHSSAVLLLNAARHGGAARRSCFPATVNFSTEVAKAASSSKALLRFLEAEIECADEEEDKEEAEDVPAEFPFKIEDNLGEAVVKLTRQYEGETIEVEIYMPDLSGGDDEYDDDKDNEKNNDDLENGPQSNLPLLVKVSKDVGPSLEFSCTATPDEVHIDNLTVKNPENSEDMAYDGPDFGDLDENLQKAFHKYLNVRGISPSTTNFMHEYMVNKDGREYKMWLKNLKKFVEA